MPPKKKRKTYVDPATKAANRALIRQVEQQDTWQPARVTPPNTGVVEGTDHVASFKTGREGGPRSGHTLISSGDYREDSDGFDANHDHYGAGSGRNNNGTSRGHYSGPGA